LQKSGTSEAFGFHLGDLECNLVFGLTILGAFAASVFKRDGAAWHFVNDKGVRFILVHVVFGRVGCLGAPHHWNLLVGHGLGSALGSAALRHRDSSRSLRNLAMSALFATLEVFECGFPSLHLSVICAITSCGSKNSVGNSSLWMSSVQFVPCPCLFDALATHGEPAFHGVLCMRFFRLPTFHCMPLLMAAAGTVDEGKISQDQPRMLSPFA
jgi:hypothetical protein